MKTIIDFLCVISGTRQDALVRAPSGRGQAATLGLLFILTAIISAFTGGYALHKAFLGAAYAVPLAVVGGAAWGAVVFCIDRLMVMGADRFNRPWLQFLLRLPLAIIISLVMSKPLILRVSETMLDREIRNQRTQAIQAETTANATALVERRNTLNKLAEMKQQLEVRLDQEPDTFRYRSSNEALLSAEERFQRVQSTNLQRIVLARRDIAQILGRSEPLNTAERSRILALNQQIVRDQREIGLSRDAVGEARLEFQEAGREWLKDTSTRLEATDEELKTVRADEARMSPIVEARNKQTTVEISRLMVPNLVNQYATLKRVEASSHPDAAALRAFDLSLDFLFLVLELTPILMKVLSKKSALDFANAALDFEDENKTNDEANRNVRRAQQMSAAREKIEEKAIEVWRDSQLTDVQGRVLTMADLQQLFNFSYA